MNRLRTLILGTAAIAAGMIAILSVGSSFASTGKGSRAIEGSWQVRLTPTSDSPQFDEMMTFSAGGGIVESNNFPFHLLGLSAGPGHGTWSYTRDHSFPFTFTKFLYAPDGQAAGTLKVQGTITYSLADDTWSGPANVSICDNQANNCFQIDVTNGAATRINAGS